MSEIFGFISAAAGAGLIGFILGRVTGRHAGWQDIIDNRVRFYEGVGFVHIDDQMGGW